MIASITASTPASADGVGDVREAADQPEDQRRQREQGEEARLRGQPGDAVAHADADGRDDEPGERAAGRERVRAPGAGAVSRRSWGNRNRRTLGGCGPTSSPTSSRPPAASTLLRSDAALAEAVDAVGHARPTPTGPAPSTTLGALAGTPEVRAVGRPGRPRHPGAAHPRRPPASGSTRWSSTRPTTASCEVAVGNGLTAEPWTRPAGSGAHARRAAGFVVWSQVEAGHLCPVSMTYAAAPALAAEPDARRPLDAGPRLARLRPGAARRCATRQG